MRVIPLFAAVLALNAQAQLSHGGAPIGWGAPPSHFALPPATTLDTIVHSDDTALVTTDTLGGFRFGEQRMVPVNILAYGLWENTPDGGR
ncbi:MAG: hypothetical protein ABI373_04640, partial [Flavobacteriales bacterium]